MPCWRLLLKNILFSLPFSNKKLCTHTHPTQYYQICSFCWPWQLWWEISNREQRGKWMKARGQIKGALVNEKTQSLLQSRWLWEPPLPPSSMLIWSGLTGILWGTCQCVRMCVLCMYVCVVHVFALTFLSLRGASWVFEVFLEKCS